ncbi:MAG: hypothetical protein EXR86_00430 [Gammaproteobacteria bacterium]|nr:hypothetical protein [Gammaproteobacteria bacterium]
MTQPFLEPIEVPEVARAIRVIGSTIGDSGMKNAIQPHWNGFDGECYAIPCRSSQKETLALEVIKPYIEQFLAFSNRHPELLFEITHFAPYRAQELAPLFKQAPGNCELPGAWQRLLEPTVPLRVLLNDPEHRLGELGVQRALQTFIETLGRRENAAIQLVVAGGDVTQRIQSLTAQLLGISTTLIEVPPMRKAYERALETELRAVRCATDLLTIPTRAAAARNSSGVRLSALARRVGLTLHELTLGS